MFSLRSGVTKKLLSYFFINPDEKLYTNELLRKLKLDKRNLLRKIKELEGEGLIKSETRGNLKFYSMNKSYPLYNEYRSIVFKTIGIEKRLSEIMGQLPGVKKAYIYGSYPQGKMDVHSDIDLLVVGSHKILLLQKKLNALQKEIDREINAVNMEEKDFAARVKGKDPFIRGILERKHIELAI
ncbi:MAG: nucleotidyltransferase domain-containing protein [Candidatus Omnitrophica bacterium]|nr:nucleotidyltransferase domain-containing protein [Candidatus Omnitrophota bacterium]